MERVHYTRFEAVFRNATLVFTSNDQKFRSRLDVYNYVCAKLAKFYATQIKLGKMTIDEVPAKVRELTRKLLEKEQEG